LKAFLLFVFAILVLGLLIPQQLRMPVEGAGSASYNKASYWYYPWGPSVTHKGVDIFAPKGTAVHSSVRGLVLMKGNFGRGGKVVLILGPKWRLHYFAHLSEIKTSVLAFVTPTSVIGTVGNSGNAQGKPPHLHYSIFTMLPYPWNIDGDHQGWMKMFYLNPISYF